MSDTFKRKVQSSNLAGYEFTPHEEEPPYDFGTLRVEFKNGRVYEYSDFPGALLDELLEVTDQGGSVGSFFSREIRNRFTATEVTE